VAASLLVYQSTHYLARMLEALVETSVFLHIQHIVQLGHTTWQSSVSFDWRILSRINNHRFNGFETDWQRQRIIMELRLVIVCESWRIIPAHHYYKAFFRHAAPFVSKVMHDWP
jgi:hypothetical protein